jgi:hypothetical protein
MTADIGCCNPSVNRICLSFSSNFRHHKWKTQNMFYFKEFIHQKGNIKKYSAKDSVKVSESTFKKETANRNHYELNTNVEFYVTYLFLSLHFYVFVL